MKKLPETIDADNSLNELCQNSIDLIDDCSITKNEPKSIENTEFSYQK